MENRTYIAIDLKSFYASVECIRRGLDPLTTNLVVADSSRTEKTICLAVSPALKSFGISARPRLFEVVQKVDEINTKRRNALPKHAFSGKSTNMLELKNTLSLELDYVVAPPAMAAYIETSTEIYSIYLKYFSPEDIHVYSIDEVFIDATHYLKFYNLPAQELAGKIISEVLQKTGITATVGIGTNLYLSKVAMDIVAKHLPADKHGVRIACLNEVSYRKLLWSHRPLTDFWRVGHGYAKKLEKVGLFTMGDIARCSLGKPGAFHNEALLYKLFGTNAELLIDHAWGWEPCTMASIKAYHPGNHSLGTGQVLHCPYRSEHAALVTKEMGDLLILDLVRKKLTTNQIILTVGYDVDNLVDPGRRAAYSGKIVSDHYGRQIPAHAHGSIHLGRHTNSAQKIQNALSSLYKKITNPELLVRRINITAGNVLPETEISLCDSQQMDFFSGESCCSELSNDMQKEHQRQLAILSIQKKYGKNALLKGMNLEEHATTVARNTQIGGHKA